MAGKIQLSSIKTNIGGLTSVRDVDTHLRKTLTQLITEINDVFSDNVHEIAEVKKVFAVEKDLPNDDDGVPRYELLGGIEFKNITGKGTSKGIPAKPLNSNFKQTPVQGEYVLIQRFFGEYYYTPQVNIFNHPNNSSYQGFSTRFLSDRSNNDETIEKDNTGIVENKSANQVRTLGDNFLSNFNFRQIIPEEGSVTLNGRFGNSIRLGSNIKNSLQNSPNIKLRAGQLQDATKFGEESLIEDLDSKPISAGVEENINSDGSSLWMTTDETVSITPATLEDTNIYPTEVAPAEFGGKQIILNSGRLIFNSKEDGILGFSNGPVDFSTLNTFGVSAKQGLNLYSPIMNIGRDGNDEPGKTKDIIFRSSNVTTSAVDGRVETYSTNIGLYGDLSTVGPSPAVRGNELREILEEMITVMKTTTSTVQQLISVVTAITPATPSGVAAGPLAAQITENIFKQVDAKLKLPTMLSRVVEIE